MKRCPHFFSHPLPLYNAMIGNSVTFVQVALHCTGVIHCAIFLFFLVWYFWESFAWLAPLPWYTEAPFHRNPTTVRYPKNIPSVSVTEPFPWPQDTHVSIVNGYIATGLKSHWIPGWNIHHSDLLHMAHCIYDTCAMCNGSYMTYCIWRCLNTGSVRIQQQCLHNTSWLGLFSGTVFVRMYLCICICICMYFYTAAAVSA